MIRIFDKIVVQLVVNLIFIECCNAKQDLQGLQKLTIGGKYLIQSKLESDAILKLPIKDLLQGTDYELRITYYGYDALEFEIKFCNQNLENTLGISDRQNNNKRNRILDNHNYYFKTHKNNKYFAYALNEPLEDCKAGVIDENGEEFYIVKVKPFSHTYINKKRQNWNEPIKFVVSFIKYNSNEKQKRAWALIIVCGVVFFILGQQFKNYFIPDFFNYKKVAKN